MNLFSSLTRRPEPQRSGDLPLSFDQWVQQLAHGPTQTLVNKRQEIGGSFHGYVEGALKGNGVIFACMAARSLLFTEARFQWRGLLNGRPGDLFGNTDLQVLEAPWANGTTGDLLAAAIQDVDLAGNFYARRRPGNRLFRMRPDWVTIILGTNTLPTAPYDGEGDTFLAGDMDTEVVGYLYHPGGMYSGRDPVVMLPAEVVHWAPTKDPSAWFRGMSWITPIVQELLADQASTNHQLEFFTNGATPNMVIALDPAIQAAQFREWEDIFRASQEGIGNQYRTLLLGGGADAKVVGADFKQIDFAVTKGHGETRVCAAARVPPIIVGMSEGLQSATYSNYGMARRAFADLTMRPLWRTFANALETILPTPSGAHLWYDDRDIAFLQEDQIDAANAQATTMATIKSAIDAGFDPDAAVAASMAGDLGRLKGSHTGMTSVQLLPPGTQKNPGPGPGSPPNSPPDASTNGNGAKPAPAPAP